MLFTKIFKLATLSLIISSCSTTTDVVSKRRISKRKYTNGLVFKKSNPTILLAKNHLKPNVKEFTYDKVIKSATSKNTQNDLIVLNDRDKKSTFKSSTSQSDKNTVNQKIFLNPNPPKTTFNSKVKIKTFNSFSTELNEESIVDPVSIVSGIAGILSFLTWPLLGIAAIVNSWSFGLILAVSTPLAIAALVLGIIGTVRKANNKESYKGVGLAIAGIWLGAIWTFIDLISILLYFGL